MGPTDGPAAPLQEEAAPYPTHAQAWWLPRVPPEVTFTVTGMPPPKEGDEEMTEEEEEEEEDDEDDEEWRKSTKWRVYPVETWGWLETELAVAAVEARLVQSVRRNCRPLTAADDPEAPLPAQAAA
jgi:hypothetical protein